MHPKSHHNALINRESNIEFAAINHLKSANDSFNTHILIQR